MYKISINNNNNFYTINMKRNQYSSINFRSVGQSAAESTISKLKTLPFDEFYREAKILMSNMQRTNSMDSSENQTIKRFIDERLEFYRPIMELYKKQLEESIQKRKDAVYADCKKEDIKFIEKYINNPNAQKK